MTIYGTTDGRVVGQPISPSFGAQNGASAAGAGLIELPAGMPLLVAMSLGLVPINALITSVNSVTVGANTGFNGIGADFCTVGEALSNGNGDATFRGSSVAPAGAINTQIFADGFVAASAIGNGATPKNTSALTEAPVSGGTFCNNVVLTANGFGG